jgi:hypothetical protein
MLLNILILLKSGKDLGGSGYPYHVVHLMLQVDPWIPSLLFFFPLPHRTNKAFPKISHKKFQYNNNKWHIHVGRESGPSTTFRCQLGQLVTVSLPSLAHYAASVEKIINLQIWQWAHHSCSFHSFKVFLNSLVNWPISKDFGFPRLFCICMLKMILCKYVSAFFFLHNILPHPMEVVLSDLRKSGGTNPH